MNVLIIGGTGFLGYHATHEFLRRGHSVTALARHHVNVPNLFPPTVRIELADLNQLSDEAVQNLVSGHQAVVYAAGVDAAAPVQGDPFEFFHKENAEAVARFFRLSRMAGAKRGVLINSYFSYFNRTRPDLHLADNHPYIRSRCDQARESLAAALPDLELMVLELPWVFGVTPGRVPSWKGIVKYVQSPLPLLFTAGGTNMVAVSHVAEAIVNAIEHGKAGESYLVGEENLTWREFLERIARLVGNNKRVITIPTPIVRTALSAFQIVRNLQGKSSGLIPSKFVDFQTMNSFFDPGPSREALGYGKGGFDEALADTVRASLTLNPNDRSRHSTS